MKNLASALFAFVLFASLSLPAMAQDEKTPATQANDEQMAQPGGEAQSDEEAAEEPTDDDSPMCSMSGGNTCAMMSGKPAGCMCGPDCQCPDCPMKKGVMGMGMMHEPGCGCGMCSERKMGMMDGRHGDIEMMTWPRMNRSCRMPDYYLRLRDQLNLSPFQADSLRKLEAAMKKEAILKGAQVKALELELSEIVRATDFKVSDAVAKLKEVEAARLELRTAMVKIAGSARDVLGPEQLEKMKNLDMAGGMCGTMGGNMNGMKKMMMKKMLQRNMGQ